MRVHPAYVAAAVAGVALAGFIGLFASSSIDTLGPGLETALSPVLRIERGPASELYRDETTACFSLRFTKLAVARPVKYLFFAETPSSEPLALSWYMADRDNSHLGYDLENHPVGTRWTRRYCFELPGTVANWQTMTITGVALHRRNPFWITRTPTPPIEICPTAQGLNGGCAAPP